MFFMLVDKGREKYLVVALGRLPCRGIMARSAVVGEYHG